MAINFDFSVVVKRCDATAAGMRFEQYAAEAYDNNGILIAKSTGWSENGARNNVAGQVYKYYREHARKDIVATNRLNGRRSKNWKPITLDYRRL